MRVLETGVSLISDRLKEVRARMDAAAVRSSRAPDDVTLVAVSKMHPPAIVREAIACGVTDLGENKIQEADEKISLVGRHAARWHLIGHLQSNKARKAIVLFDMIHSLDSVALAQRLERMCEEENRAELPVLIQVELAHEQTKSGVTPNELPAVVDAIDNCRHLHLQGLMTLPPFLDPEQVRPFFRQLRGLRDELYRQGVFRQGRGELSMGMTHDYEVAIEEGATIVRVGTAIFGERKMRSSA